LHNAEDKGLINDGSCYSSRPGQEARTVVFMEIMQMEVNELLLSQTLYKV
jgi:hypothetical protein